MPLLDKVSFAELTSSPSISSQPACGFEHVAFSSTFDEAGWEISKVPLPPNDRVFPLTSTSAATSAALTATEYAPDAMPSENSTDPPVPSVASSTKLTEGTALPAAFLAEVSSRLSAFGPNE